MTASLVFKIANSLAMLGWLTMIILPSHRHTPRIIISGFVLLLSIAYAYLIINGLMHPSGEGGSFSSLEGVMTLFQNPNAVLAGWIHYLAFDMMIGLFITLNAARQGIHRWVVLPALFFTFMLGPTGLLLYYLLVAVKQRNVFPDFNLLPQ